MIDTLSCASLGDVCLALFPRYDAETNDYDKRDVNSLSANIVEVSEAFRAISKHPAHEVGIDIDKTFKRQIVELHKLYLNDTCR